MDQPELPLAGKPQVEECGLPLLSRLESPAVLERGAEAQQTRALLVFFPAVDKTRPATLGGRHQGTA